MIKRSPQSIDGESLERQRLFLDVERTRQQGIDSLDQRSIYSGFVANKPELSVANPERQLGKPKLGHLFYEEVRRLNPNLLWVPNMKHVDSADMYCQLPDGNLNYICRTQALVMPEWSIFEPVYEEFPSMATHFEPDTPETEIRKTCAREIYRGWRTVLLRIIQNGFLNREEVELKFGPGDRPSWAINLGRIKRRNELVA